MLVKAEVNNRLVEIFVNSIKTKESYWVLLNLFRKKYRCNSHVLTAIRFKKKIYF